jgi:hypothetical protein
VQQHIHDEKETMEDVSNQDCFRNDTAFHPALVRRLINSKENFHSNVRKTMTHEATIAVGAILQLFVQEAVHRASIEAEIEYESGITKETSDSKESTVEKIPIRADHISKIAAELLMDFT